MNKDRRKEIGQNPPNPQIFHSVFQEHIFSVKQISLLSGVALYFKRKYFKRKYNFMEVMYLFLIDLQMQGQLSKGGG